MDPVISVMLAVPDAGEAARWYARALGATELWNVGSVIGLTIGGAPFFLGEPEGNGWDTPAAAGTRTVRVEVFVDDPDAFVRRAVQAGADGDEVRDHETPWGVHRQGGFLDPYGHRWLVGDRSPLRGLGPGVTTEISALLTAAAERTVPVVRGIADEQLDNPTPCTEYRVRDLLNHLFLIVTNFQSLAYRKPVDFDHTPDVIDGDWRSRFATEAERLAAAWAHPAALEGDSPVLELPQPVVGGMALTDLTVHGWDLARATGQPYEPDPAVVTHLRPQVEELIPEARKTGAFAEPVQAAPDATEFAQLLALMGRAV